MRDVPPFSSHSPLSADDLALLDRYYAGLTDAGESHRAERLLQEHRQERWLTEAVRAELRGSATPPSTEEVRVRFRRFRESLARHGERRVGTASWHRFWSSTAWVTLGAAAVATMWTLASVSRRSGPPPSPLEYSTENGERARITLPDGNTVSLDVGTHLSVPADYASGNHVVTLVGEALFDVTRHSGRSPLTVIAGGTAARVLGTQFIVRRYRTDSSTTVAVREGRVAVGAAVATARRLIEVGPRGAIRTGVAKPSLFAFATGVLALDSVPLLRAIPDLDRWYDVDIRLGNPILAAQMIDGRFTAGSVAEFIEILEGTYDMHVVRHGRVLTIYSGARR